MLVSLIGKSNSGKSLIAQTFLQLNSNIIHCDIDKIGHQVIEDPNIKQKLLVAFGKQILVEGKVNRKELGKIVFNSIDKMEQLNQITWSKMEEQIDEVIGKNKDKIIILDWQLLPKTKYFTLSDLKILVDAPFAMRMARAIKRDKIIKEKFEEREKASLTVNLDQIDYYINNIDRMETKRKVKEIYDKSIISR